MATVIAATLPALYQGDDLSGIYSADGLVPEVLAFVPLYVWTIALSTGILRRRRQPLLAQRTPSSDGRNAELASARAASSWRSGGDAVEEQPRQLAEYDGSAQSCPGWSCFGCNGERLSRSSALPT
jgi:hypothetical protein